MMRYAWLMFGFASALLIPGCAASAQTCPLGGTTSNKLVCVIPQAYGPFGLSKTTNATQSVLSTGDNHDAHFGSDFLATFTPINEAVGIQLSRLPLASPSSGIIFVFDPSLKTFSPSTDESLGPILGERAGTIGKHRLFIGFSYQYFDFSSIDGTDMNNIPVILTHTPLPQSVLNRLPQPPGCANTTGFTAVNGYLNPTQPCFVRDLIETNNSIDLKAHQYTIYLNYGLTNRLDISAAIPLLDVRMAVTSTATIQPHSVAPAGTAGAFGGDWHTFNSCAPAGSDTTKCNPAVATTCTAQPCLVSTFSDSGNASGVGDVVLRGKYTVYRGERFSAAGGVDVRLPTGDATNFLGSGAVGVEPFGVISYRARIAPHAEFGYEWNGDSILGGNDIVPPPSGQTIVPKSSLPGRIIYILGADVRVTRRITGAFDVYGQRLFKSPELASQPYTDLGSCGGPTTTPADCPTYTPGTTHANVGAMNTDINIDDASLGLKARLVGRLVVTGNVLIKMNNGGLRSKAVPLVGVSYSF